MRARVPYLARLVQQATGRATLLPPRQLFVGDAYTPVRSPGRDDALRQRTGGDAAGISRALPPSAADEEPPTPPGIALPRGEDTHGDRASGAPGASAELAYNAGVPALPVASAVRAMAPGVPATPGGPDVPGPPDGAPQSLSAARAESPGAVGKAPVTPVTAGSVPQPVTPPPVTPPPSSSSRPAGDTARAQPPTSWTSPLWGTPVDLPQAIELSSVTGETDRRAPSRPGAATPPPRPGPAATAGPHQRPPTTESATPATPPPRPGPAATAGPHQRPPTTESATPATPPPRPGPAATAGPHQRPPTTESATPATPPPRPGPAATASPHQRPPTTESATPATLGGRDAADQERSGGRTAVRDLIPPPSSASRSIAMLGPELGELHQKPRVSGRPRVSIGTIEVTVLPPAPPAPTTQEIRPPAQVARGWTRPPSLLAATAGADRLRDGLRRWYGTAQG